VTERRRLPATGTDRRLVRKYPFVPRPPTEMSEMQRDWGEKTNIAEQSNQLKKATKSD
jgi:hypothetical protein